MVEFATFEILRSIKRGLNERILLRNAQESLEGKDIFLSYASKDAEFLAAVIRVLKDHRGSVYIDNGDDRLPASTSPETARLLKDAIRATKKLVVFVTTNSKSSRWVPWELGLGDGLKGSVNVSLFPTAEYQDEKDWATVEYLGLYRSIVWGTLKSKSKPEWLVWDHNTNKAQPLADWIAK